uniref:Uncharacterized protein n=1 Tax=Setaria viridis TaxID=4556 RepID=A0A4U6V896_SETVI|nr:hypothetical protein SEVIR_3G056900v2 [Setaria viridis]
MNNNRSCSRRALDIDTPQIISAGKAYTTSNQSPWYPAMAGMASATTSSFSVRSARAPDDGLYYCINRRGRLIMITTRVDRYSSTCSTYLPLFRSFFRLRRGKYTGDSDDHSISPLPAQSTPFHHQDPCSS